MSILSRALKDASHENVSTDVMNNFDNMEQTGHEISPISISSPMQHPAVTRAREAHTIPPYTEWPPLPRRRVSTPPRSRVFRVLSRRNSVNGLNESYLIVPFARTGSGSSLSTLTDMLSEPEAL